jgi:RecA-family ATPase
LYIRGAAGDPLPVVWPSLAQNGTTFRRGQLALICAGPGTGKSALVLAYALKSRLPTLYFSADSDAFTQTSRAVSILSGCTLARSMNDVREDRIDPDVAEQLDKIPIRFGYKASPSLDVIEDSMAAYDALYEDYPALVVVDNITNVRTDAGDADDPFSGMESLMDYLHEMARETGSCVIGLHHVTGPHNDGDKPIPLSGIKGQIGRVPEMILTLHRVKSEYGPELLNVSTVKNRGGKSDPSGFGFASLSFEGETMQIRELT